MQSVNDFLSTLQLLINKIEKNISTNQMTETDAVKLVGHLRAGIEQLKVNPLVIFDSNKCLYPLIYQLHLTLREPNGLSKIEYFDKILQKVEADYKERSDCKMGETSRKVEDSTSSMRSFGDKEVNSLIFKNVLEPYVTMFKDDDSKVELDEALRFFEELKGIISFLRHNPSRKVSRKSVREGQAVAALDPLIWILESGMGDSDFMQKLNKYEIIVNNAEQDYLNHVMGEQNFTNDTSSLTNEVLKKQQYLKTYPHH